MVDLMKAAESELADRVEHVTAAAGEHTNAESSHHEDNGIDSLYLLRPAEKSDEKRTATSGLNLGMPSSVDFWTAPAIEPSLRRRKLVATGGEKSCIEDRQVCTDATGNGMAASADERTSRSDEHGLWRLNFYSDNISLSDGQRVSI